MDEESVEILRVIEEHFKGRCTIVKLQKPGDKSYDGTMVLFHSQVCVGSLYLRVPREEEDEG